MIIAGWSVLAAFVMAGCEPNGPIAPNSGAMVEVSGSGAPSAPAADPVAPQAGQTPRWPFWPSKMRVHPTTRIAPDPESGQATIEARIEFRDAENVVTRASGVIRLDLHDRAAAGAGQEIGSWELDLRDLSVNRARFDDVTRTYLFRMSLEQIALPEHAVLRVYFLSADGATLSADQELHVQTPGP